MFELFLTKIRIANFEIQSAGCLTTLIIATRYFPSSRISIGFLNNHYCLCSRAELNSNQQHSGGKTLKKKIRAALKAFLAFCCLYIISVYAVALLSSPPLIGKGAVPLHLKDAPHGDYLFFKSIPVSWSSFRFSEPPKLLIGNNLLFHKGRDGGYGPAPIPQKGGWQIAVIQEKTGWPIFLPYFAITTGGGWHFRIGCRWDDVDHYYVFPSIAVTHNK
jgi:hypothetical protein